MRQMIGISCTAPSRWVTISFIFWRGTAEARPSMLRVSPPFRPSEDYADQIGAVDALEALGDDGAHAQEVLAPFAARSRGEPCDGTCERLISPERRPISIPALSTRSSASQALDCLCAGTPCTLCPASCRARGQCRRSLRRSAPDRRPQTPPQDRRARPPAMSDCQSGPKRLFQSVFQYSFASFVAAFPPGAKAKKTGGIRFRREAV